ncbi:MAG: protein kinase domain-containing protein, partial [Acidobacteriota bacterium]
LDFGLAKALDPATLPAPGLAANSPALMNSPTLAASGTQMGVILGTAAYMAPEQAKGLAVDERADIWAFGVVLFEMLSGKRLFAGDSVPETLAEVLKSPIDFTHLPPQTPAAVRRLLRRCLDRSPKERLRAIGDARIELDELRRGQADAEPAAAAPASPATPWSRRLAWLALGAVLAGGAVWAFYARRQPATALPTRFAQLSFGRGYAQSARFLPDGQTVVYSAADEGAPLTLRSTRIDAVDSRPLDLPAGDVVGVSRGGEMALLLGRHHVGSWASIGTLAQVGFAGGAPREILEDVYDADIAPDGKSFAVVRAAASGQQLEYPIGHPVFHSDGWISQPRIAADGARVAFVDHPFTGDDRGFVTLIDGGQHAQRLSEDVNYLQGIAWSADGREIWASGGDATTGAVLIACAPGRTPRVLLRAPGGLRLQDVSSTGRVLLILDDTRSDVEGRLRGDRESRRYSWWDNDVPKSIADDGSVMVASSSLTSAEGEYISYYRRDAGSPVQIGGGTVGGMSPDGRWIYLVNIKAPNTLRVVPTGPGAGRQIVLGNVQPRFDGLQRTDSSADGRYQAFVGLVPGEGTRGYLLDLQTAAPPRAITPLGVWFIRLSPDGTKVAELSSEGGLRIRTIATGAAITVPGATRTDLPLAWDSASASLFVWDQTFPAHVERLDPASGKRTPALEFEPRDPAGILYGQAVLTTDGRYFLFRFRRSLSTLFVGEGLR